MSKAAQLWNRYGLQVAILLMLLGVFTVIAP